MSKYSRQVLQVFATEVSQKLMTWQIALYLPSQVFNDFGNYVEVSYFNFDENVNTAKLFFSSGF